MDNETPEPQSAESAQTRVQRVCENTSNQMETILE